VKHVVDGSIEKYKARFVDRGFSQKEGVDYDKTFALVARDTYIKTIMPLASIFGLELYLLSNGC
jgi:hypothetical protein